MRASQFALIIAATLEFVTPDMNLDSINNLNFNPFPCFERFVNSYDPDPDRNDHSIKCRN